MKLDRTLIDKHVVPTLDELREFFRHHDITSIPPKLDPTKMDAPTVNIYFYIKDIIDAEWDNVGREM